MKKHPLLVKTPKVINLESIENQVDYSDTLPIYARIIEATRCIETGATIETFEMYFPRPILAEQNTHRVFSRNTGSSRAIPLKTMLRELRRTPFIPMFWGKNKSGMQSAETLPWFKAKMCSIAWSIHRVLTFATVKFLSKMDLHKQWANRLLEPHTYIRQVVTSTSWDNYITLRHHDDAQPEIVALAYMVKKELATYRADEYAMYRRVSCTHKKNAFHWHLPYITEEERVEFQHRPLYLAKLSAARCARTSYLTQEGISPRPEREMGTFKKLAESSPIHASPLEHQAFPAKKRNRQSRNFVGFNQYRAYFENHEHGQPVSEHTEML